MVGVWRHLQVPYLACPSALCRLDFGTNVGPHHQPTGISSCGSSQREGAEGMGGVVAMRDTLRASGALEEEVYEMEALWEPLCGDGQHMRCP